MRNTMFRRLSLACLAALALLATAAQAAEARPLRLASIRCFGVDGYTCPGSGAVPAGGAAKLAVRNSPQTIVLWRDSQGKFREVRPWWRTAKRLWVRVPSWAASGRVRVVEGGKRSNPIKVKVTEALGAASAFADDAMWIWQLEQVEAGNV